MERIGLTAELVEGFSGAFISPIYDNPQPTPEFHRQGWELYCSDAPLASIVAPREHAKSTAFTQDFGLATILFRAQDYIVVVSATEKLSIEHLEEIAKVLRDNEEVEEEFGIRGLSVDSKTEIVVDFDDGHQAKVIARGSGQKMRGLKWNGKRPGLILGDDLEDDEQVESLDQRKKFRRWFNRALIPCMRRGGIARIHGTILHQDSLLARLQKNSEWKCLFFKAHASFNDFSHPLWPEQFPKPRLMAIRQRFINDSDAAGYSQEYLNSPMDDALAFLHPEGFLPMLPEDFMSPKKVKIGCDWAVSKSDQANQTSFIVGGQTSSNLICVFDNHTGRWDTEEWINEMFSLQIEHDPEEWVVEGGVIWNAVWPTIRKEMRLRDVWMEFRVINPVRDKAARALAFKKRHRSGAMRYSKDSHWYPDYEAEVKMFTGTTEALADDQFDATAILVRGFEQEAPVDDEDFRTDEDWEMEEQDPRRREGRDPVTGY